MRDAFLVQVILLNKPPSLSASALAKPLLTQNAGPVESSSTSSNSEANSEAEAELSNEETEPTQAKAAATRKKEVQKRFQNHHDT